MSAHLKIVRNNPQVIGYWIIDVWEGDYGGAKIALQKINSLIHKYTPDKYSICGISGNTNAWNDEKAANFSPQGCGQGRNIYLSLWIRQAVYGKEYSLNIF